MSALVESYKLHGREVEVRREDLRIGKPYVRHGKTPSICALMTSLAFERRFGAAHAGVSCFASRGSDWALNAAIAAHTAGLKLTIYAQHPSAKNPLARFLCSAVDDYYARLAFVSANHTQIMISQARKRATAEGDFFIPFGFELPVCMRELTDRLRGFDKTATIVLCAGSGITLACLLKAALIDGKRFKRVVAVSSGRSAKAIGSAVARHVTELDLSCATARLDIDDGGFYGPGEFAIETPWPTHPFYEQKAFAWLDATLKYNDPEEQLEDPIAFLNM